MTDAQRISNEVDRMIRESSNEQSTLNDRRYSSEWDRMSQSQRDSIWQQTDWCVGAIEALQQVQAWIKKNAEVE